MNVVLLFDFGGSCTVTYCYAVIGMRRKRYCTVLGVVQARTLFAQITIRRIHKLANMMVILMIIFSTLKL